MVSAPPPPAMVEALLTATEKTRESASAPPEIELVTRSAPVVNTKVSAPAPPMMVEAGCSHRKGERVTVSTKIDGAIGNCTLEDHAVGAGTSKDLSARNSAGEQEEIRSCVPVTIAPLLTPAEKFRVSSPAPPEIKPPDRSPLKETESLPAPPAIVDAVCRSEPVTTKVSLPVPPAIEAVASTNRESEHLIASTEVDGCTTLQRTSD